MFRSGREKTSITLVLSNAFCATADELQHVTIVLSQRDRNPYGSCHNSDPSSFYLANHLSQCRERTFASMEFVPCDRPFERALVISDRTDNGEVHSALVWRNAGSLEYMHAVLPDGLAGGVCL